MPRALTISNEPLLAPKTNIAEVIATYSKRLFGFIRQRVESEEDAEDILQDVFYQFIGSAQPIGQVSGWLFRVARNKITDEYRRKHPELLEDLYPERGDEDQLNWTELFFDAENPETEYLRSMFWDVLDQALQELPAEQRDVFILNELDGVPFKVLAAQCGETVNTLISRKRYAVLHLRERLRVLKDELLNY
ncbi:sigma-70 family RNA polymerase sigma factor [Segetibacter sp. 3557_3]|uniref:RNA polymerase sigma factor n=1 Tax=Segetibacter sp. 3557_3 TaxID=2547429 RepID=UPI0010589490|nr:sigma-70 family RNA polymerase sigma factor [Segetibacter sp. 3557_3]TDH26223.1 sigma-70 family RNA polymerase sigma factor [Segetibacter sp. 3557_3]